MAIITDATGRQLAQAVGGIDTTGLVKDSTLQATNTELSNIDTTGQSIVSAISGLGTALGNDKANISGDNIADKSTFRQNIELQKNTPTVTASGSNVIAFSSIAQIGNLVSGFIEITIARASLTVWQNIATIDVKPTTNVKFPAVRTGNGTHTGMLEINTDGLVRLFSTQALSSNNVAFTFGYRTN